MHNFVSRLSVTSLFGYLDHDVHLRVSESSITILTGGNGSGKTHVLNILRSLVAFDYLSFAKLPCVRAQLEYVSSKQLTFERLQSDEMLRISGHDGAKDMGELLLRILPDPLEDAVPPYIDRLDDDLWIDRTDGELLSTSMVRTRYAPRQSRIRPGVEIVGDPTHDIETWLRIFRAESVPTLVETQRLDLQLSLVSRRGSFGNRVSVSRIRQYVDQVAEQIAAARRASLEESQRADRQFAARALDKARDTVREPALRQNYQS